MENFKVSLFHPEADDVLIGEWHWSAVGSLRTFPSLNHYIVSIQLINLVTTLFLYFLFLVLVLCIDYNGLIDLRTSESYLYDFIHLENLVNSNFLADDSSSVK